MPKIVNETLQGPKMDLAILPKLLSFNNKALNAS